MLSLAFGPNSVDLAVEAENEPTGGMAHVCGIVNLDILLARAVYAAVQVAARERPCTFRDPSVVHALNTREAQCLLSRPDRVASWIADDAVPQD